jgi:hypothetical protein
MIQILIQYGRPVLSVLFHIMASSGTADAITGVSTGTGFFGYNFVSTETESISRSLHTFHSRVTDVDIAG